MFLEWIPRYPALPEGQVLGQAAGARLRPRDWHHELSVRPRGCRSDLRCHRSREDHPGKISHAANLMSVLLFCRTNLVMLNI